MRRASASASLRALALVLTACLPLMGCGEQEPPVDRIGVNVVDKAIFEGAWYMSRTVIDVDYAGGALGTFPGDAASDAAQDFTAMPRIRWVIEEDFLFAFRDYTLVEGGDTVSEESDEQDDDFLGQPVAAFAIEKHFDIRRAYNAATGEEQNVIEENDTDRRWYDREFMRVDWSKNLLPGFFGQSYNLNELFGVWKREPADLFVQDASQFPDAWRPRFDSMRCNGSDDDSDACTPHERELADDYEEGELYHMSFVTQELMSPSNVDDGTNWCASRYTDAPPCTAHAAYVRTSFLKKSDRRQYESVNWTDERFERFGFFRLNRTTYDRSTAADDPAFFYTDFLNYNINRHNIWKQWHDDDGDPIPYDERDVRRVVWYTTPELPAHLVGPSFDVVGQWNEAMMETVRRLRDETPPSYPEVDCQDDDPDGYCFCQPDPRTGDIMRPSCPGRYDPFESPEDAEARGVERPYDCWVEAPADAEPDLDQDVLNDDDFDGWFDARFVGDECVTVLRVNTCNKRSIADNDDTREGLACEERGDLRYKFLSYIDQPGAGFLGIATLRGDPETGEILAGDANISGPGLDSFRTGSLQTYDLINGTLSEGQVLTGEDIRQYFESLGHVQQPAQPWGAITANVADGATSAVTAAAKADIDARMQQALPRLERLQGADGRANVFSDRKTALIGSDIERRLVSGPEALVAGGAEVLPAQGEPIDDDTLDRISPFRNDAGDVFAAHLDSQMRLARANVMMPNEYTDESVQGFIDRHRGWSRARLEFAVNRLLYRQTQLHELGHCLGLRHDFGASADHDHYHPEYDAIVERFPLPDPVDYDVDDEPGLSAVEQVAYDQDRDEVRAWREQAGIDGAMTSSVMDYAANWYERLQPLGRYDRAATLFAYGDLVEAYEGDPAGDTPREWFTGYMGGESCEVDADCPYAPRGERSSLLMQSNRDAKLTQRCVEGPRSGAKLCSRFDDDLAARAQDDSSLQPLRYRFCTDDRADSTLAWCNRFDEGASYRDIVRNISESYDRTYLFSAFRRYRARFSVYDYQDSVLGRRLYILQNLYHNLIFRYVSDPAFRYEEGPFGFYDQFLAATDVLNLYARILAQPQVGGYRFDERADSYRLASGNPASPDVDLPVPLGLGRNLYSDWQGGLTGVERVESLGTWYDKQWVMQLLTLRGWEAAYTRDVAFYANFYDLFPNEMQQIFGGMIQGAPQSFMPRVICEDDSKLPECDSPRLVYMDFYRGDCSSPDTCRPNPAEVTYADLPVLDDGGSLPLQIYAVIYALQDFPIFFDTSFQNQLFICIEGQGDCFEPDPNAVEGVDYVRYTSSSYLRSFLAFQLEPAVGVGEQTGLGFAMVKEARDLSIAREILLKLRDTDPPYDAEQLEQADLDALDDINYELPDAVELEIDRIDSRVGYLESFFNQVIELERRFGIESFSYFIN